MTVTLLTELPTVVMLLTSLVTSVRLQLLVVEEGTASCWLLVCILNLTMPKQLLLPGVLSAALLCCCLYEQA